MGGTARRPTIRDVARSAGVSHQTVSRYLNADPGMRPEVRERVRSAVADLGYRVDPAARSLRTRRSGRLAVLLPSGGTVGAVRMLSGATEVGHAAGYSVEAVVADGSRSALGERLSDLTGSGGFEGVLSLTPLPAPPPGGAPVVSSPDFDEHRRSIGDLADASATDELVDRLVTLGHRRMLHVAGPAGHPSADARRAAFTAALLRHGLEPAGIAEGDWDGGSGVRAVAGLAARQGITAVLAAGDPMAAGAVRGALERGLRVPEDLSVTGWDDDPVGRYLPPTLTTVATDHARRGREAMARLLAAVEGRPEPAPDPAPLNRVVWRGSTGPAPGTGPRTA